jgi:hypothetical protein
MQEESNYEVGDGYCNLLYGRVGLGTEGTPDNNSESQILR